MQVGEVMTPSAELVDANTVIRDAAVKMRDGDLRALPVGDDGRLIGMMTDRDIVVRAVAADNGGGTTAVREVMSEGLFTCYADDRVEDAARLMAEHTCAGSRWSTATRISSASSRSPISCAAARRGRADRRRAGHVTAPTPHAPRV